MTKWYFLCMGKKEKNTYTNNFSLLSGIFVIFVSLVSWFIVGPLLSYRLSSSKILNSSSWSDFGRYFIVHVPYIMLFIALFFLSHFILRTSLKSLIAGCNRRYRWTYSFFVAFIYLAFLAIFSLMQIKGISVDATPFSDKLKLVVPILILTPMQALSEEILFRALPARLVFNDRLEKNTLKSNLLIILSGVLFLIPHLKNPEVSSSFLFSSLYYFTWGSLAMALSLWTDGFEAPVAMHIANNLYIALIVNYSGSSMPTHALFINNRELSPISSLIEACIVFIAIFLFSRIMEKREEKMLKG